MRSPLVFLGAIGTLLGLTACAPDRVPAWAADTLEVPAPADGSPDLIGFQTWTLYGDRWADRPRAKHFACATVLELSLTPCDADCVPCPDCETSWTVMATEVDSDCEQDVELPVLTALGIGVLPEELASDTRAGDATSGTWARYDDDVWLAHGWADSAPDPAVPFRSRPAFAWPL